MHDTAYEIGRLVMNAYCDLATAKILEIGSLDVNGSLRDHALPTTEYVGLDFEKGAGVDIVIKPGLPLPVDDGAFDLVMASSVFEHDQAFWLTFLDMCRKARKGGFVYINAPANGWVHRYPQDNWRFYPDSGKALAKWANSQGVRVKLIESFIGDRQADGWNDFVAVFRVGIKAVPLPNTPVSEQIASSNAINWTSRDIIRPQNAPQDKQSFDEATAIAGSLYEQLAAKDAELVDERAQRAAERQDVDLKFSSLKEHLTGAYVKLAQTQSGLFLEQAKGERHRVEAQAVRNAADDREALLGTELADLRAAALSLDTEKEGLIAKLRAHELAMAAERDNLLAQAERERQQHQTAFNALEAQYHGAEDIIARLTSNATKAQNDRSQLESTLAQRTEEIEQTRRELENAATKLEEVEIEREQACRRADELDGWVFRLADERRDAQAELEKAMIAARLADIERDDACQRMATIEATTSARIQELDTELVASASAAEAEAARSQGLFGELEQARHNLLELERQLAEIEHKRASLSNQVVAAGARETEIADQLEWLRCATESMIETPRWWHVLPREVRKKREYVRLRDAGLFDAEAYLERHPDVAGEGMDPFRHYMLHGMKERRRR